VTFAAPYLLIALLAVPAAAAGYWALEGRRAKRSNPWARRAMLPNIVRRPSRGLGYLPLALFLLGLTFLLVGFARPQRVLVSTQRQAPTIVLAFDVSGSMAASDVAPTRIGAARKIAIQFLHTLPVKYRVAVVTFGNKVNLVVAPTFDRNSVLAKLPSSVTPRAGTGIGDAVSHSVSIIVNTARESGPGTFRPGAVLLLSDGAQTAGGTTPQAAIVSALVDYIPVDTIVIGTPEGIVTQPIKLNDLQISAQIPVPVRPATMRTIAQQTGGTFFDAASLAQSAAPLARVYENLHSHTSQRRKTRELNVAATALALLFIVAGLLFSGLRLGRLA
jgi:Ca-activated chloride channel family protein